MRLFIYLFLLLFISVPSYVQDDYNTSEATSYEESDEYDSGETDVSYEEDTESYGDPDDALSYQEDTETKKEDAVPPPVTAPSNVAPIQEIYIPLFSDTKSSYTVDPADPRLPDNHPLLRLKGTIWRNNEIIFETNTRGVVVANRMYLVFGQNRDAVAFVKTPSQVKGIEVYPNLDDFISLTPLLETNSYKASPYQNRYVEIPEQYRRPTSNVMLTLIPETKVEIDQNLFQAQESDSGLDTQQSEIQDSEKNNEQTNIEVVEEASYPESEDSYDNTDEDYENDTYSWQYLKKMPLSMFAQNAKVQKEVNAVINIGGMDGGIFVKENLKNPEVPYIVLFLALEKDGSLLVYTIQNSFDIRTDTPEIRQARALYKKAFETRANMKRFIQVQNSEEDSFNDIINFFK